MDTGTLILGIFFLVVIFGPFIYLITLGKNQIRNMKTALEQLTHGTQIQIDEKDIWNDKAIAIDYKLKKLLYVNYQDKKHSGNVIDLRKIKFVSIEESNGSIDLVLTTYSTAINKIAIKIHTGGVDDPVEIRGHRISAQKWKAIIHGILKNKPAPRALSA